MKAKDILVLVLIFFVSLIIVYASRAEAYHYDSVLEDINKQINKIKYVSDMENYNVPNYWAMPDEFYKNGGDCEDFVIAKYYALLDLGVDVSGAKYVYALVKHTNKPHALLQVGDYFLDNLNNKLLSRKQLDKYYFNISATEIKPILDSM